MTALNDNVRMTTYVIVKGEKKMRSANRARSKNTSRRTKNRKE
jgi:hypothetical protein